MSDKAKVNLTNLNLSFWKLWLYVWPFQFPVRPGHMSYDTSTVLSSRVRPKQQQVQLSLALDTRTKNYDGSKAEQIALNVDGTKEKRKRDQDDTENNMYPSG